MKPTLYTVGYTGFAVEGFLQTLLDNGVQCLIDAREIPISRKKGFAKTALSQHLASAGIEYHHFRLLGSPKRDRHEVRETGDYVKFFATMRLHLAIPEVDEQLREAIEIATEKTSCLMCCCPDWKFCHRSCVVEAFANSRPFRIEHLNLDSRIQSITMRRAA